MPVTLEDGGRPLRRDLFVVGGGLETYDADTDGGVGLRVVPLAAIADADGTLADLTTKFNTLLASLRTAGILLE